MSEAFLWQGLRRANEIELFLSRYFSGRSHSSFYIANYCLLNCNCRSPRFYETAWRLWGTWACGLFRITVGYQNTLQWYQLQATYHLRTESTVVLVMIRIKDFFWSRGRTDHEMITGTTCCLSACLGLYQVAPRLLEIGREGLHRQDGRYANPPRRCGSWNWFDSSWWMCKHCCSSRMDLKSCDNENIPLSSHFVWRETNQCWKRFWTFERPGREYHTRNRTSATSWTQLD